MLSVLLNQYNRVVLAIIVVLLVLTPLSRSVSAETIEQLQQKSQDLQSQIDSNNNQISELSKQEESLKVKISELGIQISQATTSIELTGTKISELKLKLEQTKKELDRQKGLLKAAIRALYARRDVSTVELLVASDSFADFIDNQEYLGRLQETVKNSADEVVQIKQQIEKEKKEQESLLAEQEKQKSLLAARNQEQQDLLDATQGEESRYRSLVASQHAELEKAESQLAALLSAGNTASLGPVTVGQKIGELGSTGYSTGPHIHFQVYKNGVTQNPSAGGNSLINGYKWPLLGGVGYISQSYGCVAPAWYYSTKCNGGLNSFHTGLDIAASAYTPIVAAASGDIIFKGCKGGLGYVVVIDHGGGWQTWYPHQVTPSGQVYGYCS